MSDNLFNGRRFQALTVVDNFSRECLAIHAGKSLKGEDVVSIMEALRVPVRIQTDNGSKFISKSLDKWAYEHGVTMDFSRPGKPTDNPSNVSIDNINIDLILSPIVYESLFNQISFMRMLDWLHQGAVPFAPQMLFSDSAIFTLPTFVFDEKSSLMYINKFGELSLLGGLSGYASAVIYFSDYYFLWYFILGITSSLLLRFTSSVNFVILSRIIYIYFVCDSLFRFNHDPWFIVIKMFVNNIVFILFVLMIIALKMRMEKRRAIQ